MVAKTQRVSEYIQNGDYRKALSIAKGFRLGLTSEERDILQGGWQGYTNPDFCRQIGKDVNSEIENAIAVLKAKWS